MIKTMIMMTMMMIIMMMMMKSLTLFRLFIRYLVDRQGLASSFIQSDTFTFFTFLLPFFFLLLLSPSSLWADWFLIISKYIKTTLKEFLFIKLRLSTLRRFFFAILLHTLLLIFSLVFLESSVTIISCYKI